MPPTTIGSVLSNVSRQSVVVLLSRGAALVLGIATTILLSRLLGPAGLGQFRLGSVVVQLLTTFCLLGLDSGLQRYLPVLETQRRKRQQNSARSKQSCGDCDFAGSFTGSPVGGASPGDVLFPFPRNDERHACI